MINIRFLPKWKKNTQSYLNNFLESLIESNYLEYEFLIMDPKYNHIKW